MVSHLLLTEPAPLAANQDDSTNDSSLRTVLTLCDLLNRELLVLIGWAKQVPGTNSDHLDGSWMFVLKSECFMFHVFYLSFYTENFLFLSSEHFLSF